VDLSRALPPVSPAPPPKAEVAPDPVAVLEPARAVPMQAPPPPRVLPPADPAPVVAGTIWVRDLPVERPVRPPIAAPPVQPFAGLRVRHSGTVDRLEWGRRRRSAFLWLLLALCLLGAGTTWALVLYRAWDIARSEPRPGEPAP
jgi:hypothetical protein